MRKYAAPDGALFWSLIKLQIGRAYGANVITLLLAVVAVCLFEFMLHRQSGVVREFEAVLLSLQWMVLACVAIWCGSFVFLTFGLKDLPLIGLLLIAIAAFFIGYSRSQPAVDVLILLAGVTLGRGAQFLLKADGRWKIEDSENEKISVFQPSTFNLQSFLIGLVMLLAFASWWHLDMSNNYYHGPRWMGLWDNPNTYGMLMGAGSALAIGLIAENLKFGKLKAEMEKQGEENQKAESRKQKFIETFAAVKSAIRHPLPAILFISAGMLGVGLVMSYSRGAWLATAIGLLYLALQTKAESGKRKAKIFWCLLPLIALAAAVVVFFWGRTPDSAPWYVKRADLGRPSAQHRATAWWAGLEIMRDHLLGVGWNNAVSTYEKNYFPPEGGAGALTTNDYMMLGTELGIPALLCFVVYVGLCFRVGRVIPCAPSPPEPSFGAHGVTCPTGEIAGGALAGSCAALVAAGKNDASSPVGTPGGTPAEPADETSAPRCDGGVAATFCDEASRLRVACRAGAIVFLVAFWFDGGLFKLPTAAMFWVLLELGAYQGEKKVDSGELRVESPKAA